MPPSGDPGQSGHDSRSAAVAWAKSAPFGGPITQWLPLWRHLDDTGAVAGELWDHWVPPPVRRLISAGLPDGEADGRRLLTWLAGIHDIGKISPAFAVQSPLIDRMVRPIVSGGGGFDSLGGLVVPERSQLRHERAGAIALHDWLVDQGFRQRQTRPFVVVVGGHHGDYPAAADLDSGGQDHLLGIGVWERARRFLLDRAAMRYDIGGRLRQWRSAFGRPAQMAVTGLVIMADWIASSADHFDLWPVDEVPDIPLAPDAEDRDRIARGLRRLALTPGWVAPSVPADIGEFFADRFPGVGAPRPVQQHAVATAEAIGGAGIIVIEAPMGEGKTEAALLAAEVLAARTGASGLIVALPTQATSNAMFSRVLEWLERLPSDSNSATDASVALVHGKASLNEEYRDLCLPWRSAVGPDYGCPKCATGGGGRDGCPHADGGRNTDSGGPARLVAVVDEWMRGRKRATLSSFVVGTIDQVLFGSLKARHVMLRQLSLIGKVVVLDEVHAADVYMASFLDRTLEWLGASGVPVILLSATLPPARRAALYGAYERGRRSVAHSAVAAAPGEAPGFGVPVAAAVDTSPLNRLLGYPSIVATPGSGVAVAGAAPGADFDGPPPTDRATDAPTAEAPTVVELEPSGRSAEVDVRRLDDDLDFLVGLLRDQLADGGCAVVVRNTVRRVQEAAERLAAEFGADQATVAHAQFLACDRLANDDRLLDLFGPPGRADRPTRHIVVASQVVEQSLDVDFDLMVTDAAPVDLVLQRLGRLHRHERGAGESDRPARLRRAQCWVTGVDWAPGGLVHARRASAAVRAPSPSLAATFARPPKPVRGSVSVYGKYPLLAALAVLERHLDGAPIRLPQDIAPLVAQAYGELEAPAGWAEVMARARTKDAEAMDRRQKNAQNYLLGPPITGADSMFDAMRAGFGQVDEDSPQGQRCVRDGGDSIEVIVVQRGADGIDRVPSWVGERPGEPLPLREYPIEDPGLARALARCSLRLPFALSNEGVIDSVIKNLESNVFPGWAKTPYLSGMLALVLDEDASAALADHRVTYDRRYGLMATSSATNSGGGDRD